MKFKTPMNSIVAMASIAVLTGLSSGNAFAASSGYAVTQTSDYVRTGSGCLLTTEWTPDQVTRECHPELVAAREQKEAEMKRAEIAALEAAKPKAIVSQTVLKEISLDATALFDFDATSLRTDGKAKLDQLAEQINNLRNVSNVILDGHTDRLGSESYTAALSRARAKAVSDYLSGVGAIAAEQITVSALGESKPVRSCAGVLDNETLIRCLEPNRRVEIKVMGVEERKAQ